MIQTILIIALAAFALWAFGKACYESGRQREADERDGFR